MIMIKTNPLKNNDFFDMEIKAINPPDSVTQGIQSGTPESNLFKI